MDPKVAISKFVRYYKYWRKLKTFPPMVFISLDEMDNAYQEFADACKDFLTKE